MFASYSPGSLAQRKLTPDDVQAVCTVYKPNSGVACNTEPKGGFSPTCDDTPSKSGICTVGAPGAPGADASGAGLTVALLGGVFGIVATLSRRRLGGRR